MKPAARDSDLRFIPEGDEPKLVLEGDFEFVTAVGALKYCRDNFNMRIGNNLLERCDLLFDRLDSVNQQTASNSVHVFRYGEEDARTILGAFEAVATRHPDPYYAYLARLILDDFRTKQARAELAEQ